MSEIAVIRQGDGEYVANSTIIYACTEDGLAIFNKPGTLPEWLPPRHVLQGQHVTAAWAEPGPPIRVLVVADGLLLLSENGGRTWDAAGPQGRTGTPVTTIRYDASGHILTVVTHDGESWRSADSGVSWQAAETAEEGLADDLEHLYRLALPPGTGPFVAIPGPAGMPAALVAGTAGGLQVSQDGGATWTRQSLPHEGGVTALARDPERRDRLYAATDSGYLSESGNRGQSWQPINADPVARVVSMYVMRI